MLDYKTSFTFIPFIASESDSIESGSEFPSEISSEETSEITSEDTSETSSEDTSEEVTSETSSEETSESVIYTETIDYSGTLYTMNENIVTLTDRFTQLSVVVYFAVALSVIILIYRIFAWFWKDL